MKGAGLPWLSLEYPVKAVFITLSFFKKYFHIFETNTESNLPMVQYNVLLNNIIESSQAVSEISKFTYIM